METFEFYPGQIEASVTIGTPVIGQYFDQDLIGSTGEMLGGFLRVGSAVGHAHWHRDWLWL